MERRGLEVRFVDGRRYTTAEALEVVRESLAEVNAALCAAIGPRAVGLMGDEIGLEARQVSKLGLVGDPLPSRPALVLSALRQGRIPVVAPLAKGPLNVNADEAAVALAAGLGAERILFVTDVPGVLVDGDVVASIGADEADRLLDNGTFEGGIVPKLQAAVRAARLGMRAEIGETAVTRVTAVAETHVLPTYARQDVTFVRGEGGWRRRLGRQALPRLPGRDRRRRARPLPPGGHGRGPRPARPPLARLEPLLDASRWLELAERLSRRFGGAQAFFCNSGAEAIEAGLKYARKATGKPGIVALEGSFHGRTLGALSVTGQPAKRAGFEPLVPDVRFARLNDAESLAAACADGDVGCILARADPGRGRHPPGDRALPRVGGRARGRRHGGLLFFDEIQCGVGRTGHVLRPRAARRQARARRARQGARQRPADRLPARRRRGAAAASRPATTPRRSAATRSRAPPPAPSCDAIDDELLEHVARDRRAGSPPGSRALPAVREVRGAGLLIGAELDRPAAPVVAGCLEAGLVVGSAGERVLRLTPPLDRLRGRGRPRARRSSPRCCA